MRHSRPRCPRRSRQCLRRSCLECPQCNRTRNASTIARGFMAEDMAAAINALPGWAKEMGIVILNATPDEVTCDLDVGVKHHQGFGIVHGGVHAGVVET